MKIHAFYDNTLTEYSDSAWGGDYTANNKFMKSIKEKSKHTSWSLFIRTE